MGDRLKRDSKTELKSMDELEHEAEMQKRMEKSTAGFIHKSEARPQQVDVGALVEALEILLRNDELGEVESQRLGLPRMIEAREKARQALSSYKEARPELDEAPIKNIVVDELFKHGVCQDIGVLRTIGFTIAKAICLAHQQGLLTKGDK